MKGSASTLPFSFKLHAVVNQAVEILVKWGDNPIHIEHSSPPTTFSFGGEPVVFARGPKAILVMLPRARGSVAMPGNGTRSFEDLIASGMAQASLEIPGAHELELPNDARAIMQHEELVFDVSASRAAERPPPAELERLPLVSFALSLLAHAGALGAMASTEPTKAMREAERADHVLLMQRLLQVSDEREQEDMPPEGMEGDDPFRSSSFFDTNPWQRSFHPGQRFEPIYLPEPEHDIEPPEGSAISDLSPVPPSSMRQGKVEVSGRLPLEVIQRIVRQNFGRFRLCYENGLRRNPTLQGRVSVRFVIGRDGVVASAQDAKSELPDQGVVSCIVRGFGNLSFPKPEGGIVAVVYPILFDVGN